MTRRAVVRRVVSAALVLAVEVWLYRRYASFGTQFHFWLHALTGGAVGLLTATVIGLRRRQPPPDPWLWGFAGHVVAATPDLAFLGVGALHVPWMDVFLGHVSVHFVPAPLPVAGGVFAAALCAWAAGTLAAWRTAIVAIAVAVAAGALALALRAPIPRSLEEVRALADTTLLSPLGLPDDENPA